MDVLVEVRLQGGMLAVKVPKGPDVSLRVVVHMSFIIYMIMCFHF